MASVALIYLGLTRPRFDSWIEFSDCLKRCDFFGIHTYDWRHVEEICYVEGDEEDSPEIRITLANNKRISFDKGLSTLKDIASTLLTGLSSEDPDTRKCVVHGLERLCLVTCYDGGDVYDPSWMAEVRKEMIPHLEKALEDSDENVRAAAAAALQRIRPAAAEDALIEIQ
jgi:HEAT repeat protein